MPKIENNPERRRWIGLTGIALTASLVVSCGLGALSYLEPLPLEVYLPGTCKPFSSQLIQNPNTGGWRFDNPLDNAFYLDQIDGGWVVHRPTVIFFNRPLPITKYRCTRGDHAFRLRDTLNSRFQENIFVGIKNLFFRNLNYITQRQYSTPTQTLNNPRDLEK
jgi:hypothetical protein